MKELSIQKQQSVNGGALWGVVAAGFGLLAAGATFMGALSSAGIS